MAEKKYDLGKLSLAIIEGFVESKLGEKFVSEIRAPTDRQIAIKGAVQTTADRLWQAWGDKRIWNAIFNHLPKNSELLAKLQVAIKDFYGHPSDTTFAEVLTEILQEHPEFSAEIRDKSVSEYITTLTEELLQADKDFRENVRGLADVRMLEILRRVEIMFRAKSQAERDMLPTFTPGSAPPKPELVIGRDDDIKELKARLDPTKGPGQSFQLLTAIKGWPGVGKTTVASVLAYDPELAERFPDGVLWTSLGQDPNIISKMDAWGLALGTDEILKAKSMQDAQSRLAALLRNKRMLLIIDDVWKAVDAVPFRVGGIGCSTLVTTRLDGVASELAPTADNVYRLKVLKDEEALTLLRKLAPGVVDQYPGECLVLVQDLEGLPLAIQVAGRMLNADANAGFGVVELIAELREGKKLLAGIAPADRSDLVTETTPTIAALLYKSVERLDPKTKDCYTYLAAFAPKPATFDKDAMKYVWQVDDAEPIVRNLVNRGLLEYMPAIDRYQMHALLVMLAKSGLEGTAIW
jgi:hypothetical protein